MTEAVDYVKTELMPDFDFDAYNHDNQDGEGSSEGPITRSSVADSVDDSIDTDIPAPAPAPTPVSTITSSGAGEEVDKW